MAFGRLGPRLSIGCRRAAMNESHVGDRLRGVLWSIRLRIWGSGVRISSGAPASSLLAQLFYPVCHGAASTPSALWKQGGSKNAPYKKIERLMLRRWRWGKLLA
jgi:hypothetical protein